MTSATTLPPEALMRKAIADRDAAFDDRFVYAVITTGIYCRPSCASRPARPENMRFYADGDTASSAGFRACKRCRPGNSHSTQDQMIEVARDIESRSDERLTLADLGKKYGLSPSRLQRSFKASFGISPRQYQDAIRTNQFRSLLKEGDDIAGAMYQAGFGSTSRVYGEAARHVGMTPSAYRAGGAGETIHYACRQTVLGPMLMAATRAGICFAQFGDDEEELLRTLGKEFPQASLVASNAKDSPELDDWITALNAHLANEAPRPDLPLDLRGTAFQVKVWRFLLGTDDGDVVSYSEVASGIDKPRAVRAAASACGANKIAVLVPCHRVLRSDGQIGGYRWGLDRKRALLDDERMRRSGQ